MRRICVGLELARAESWRRIEVPAFVKVTAGSRLGVATPVTAGGRLRLGLRRVS